MLHLLDRRGKVRLLPHAEGDTVATSLRRNLIPPPSVLVLRLDTEEILADDAVLSADVSYVARLIEGYDLSGILDAITDSPASDDQANYLARRLAITRYGSLSMQRQHLDVSSTAESVQQRVTDTIEQFGLLSDANSVVLGLSGGVDSGSLLMLLSDYLSTSERAVQLRAVTFEDFDAKYSATFEFAAKLARDRGVTHETIPADKAEEVFHLNCPIAQALVFLMETDDSHLAMYVDHHSTRRLIEVYVEENAPGSLISLGLHATDLLAGKLNAVISGYPIGPAPRRSVGRHTYIYPLAFTPKRELHLFYTNRTGLIPVQTTPNQWEFNPMDRNYLYYMADQMQWYWPGIQDWVMTAPQAPFGERFVSCQNCGGEMCSLEGEPWSGTCDVCDVLDRNGLLA